MTGQDKGIAAQSGQRRVLIVDDEHVIQMLLSSFLGEKGYLPVTASSAEEGLALLDHTAVDIALVDIRLGGMNGIQMLSEIKRKSPETEVVIITSHASLETAIEAIRNGAYDYLIKPFDDLDVIWFTLQRAFERKQLTRKNERLLAALERRNDDLSRAVKRLTSLTNAGRAMSSILDLSELLDYFVQLVSEELGAKRVSLMLLDEETNDLRIAASRGIDEEIIRTSRVKVGEGIAGRVASMGKPMLVKDVQSYPGFSGNMDPTLSGSFISLPIVLSIPIKLQETILGVINVTDRSSDQTFSDDDMSFLYSLAGEAAVAIENAKHFNELQTAYDSLKTSQSQLIVSERLNALGEMAAGVAHDFNNILAGVLGRAQLLLYRLEKSECDNDDIQANLKVIERCALQGAETVRRIQAFTCIRHDTPRESVDMNEIVHDAVEITRHKWKNECEARGIPVTLKMELGQISSVAGNSRELVQAVSNMIFNAVEAMPAGGTLQLKTKQKEDMVLLEISDTGLGLDEHAKNRIFEPFFTTKEKGNGLGLSVVYGIVKQHNGTILIESEKKAGTTFTITLPVQKDKDLHNAITEQVRFETIPSLRIMIVEDDKIIQEVFKEFLRACGHHVTVASSGEEALSLFMSDSFELVITDLSMGDMSGLSLATQLKAIGPGVRIILCSGWALQQREKELYDAGIDMAIQKPVRLADLERAIEKTMESRVKNCEKFSLDAILPDMK